MKYAITDNVSTFWLEKKILSRIWIVCYSVLYGVMCSWIPSKLWKINEKYMFRTVGQCVSVDFDRCSYLAVLFRTYVWQFFPSSLKYIVHCGANNSNVNPIRADYLKRAAWWSIKHFTNRLLFCMSPSLSY